ncbi:MAG TPA: alpha/beta hydrolase [Gemmatimonadales bacterium]|nr:alpha/beta hydrolase [Gemmatimonadales bacterium]
MHTIDTLTRQVRGVELFERRIGAGTPVVVLHGGPGAHHDYLLPGFDRLGRDRTLIYYDQRGGGRSPVPREVPVGWEEHVADLEELRVQWELERLTLVGYSWGGLLAMLYAIHHPGRVERLGLVSPAPVSRELRILFEERFQARNLTPALQEARKQLRESGLREKDPAAHARKLFALAVAGYFHDPSKAVELTPFRVTERTQKEVWASLGDFDLRPQLRELDLPALLVHGHDDPIPLESARATAQALRCPLHLIPACGHVPHVEAPEEFVAALDPFLPR